MSNVHQLVNELATYEQQRKQLEADIETLVEEYDAKLADANQYNVTLPDEIIEIYDARLKTLEEMLDNVWLKIDHLNELIDEESHMAYSHDFD